MTSRHRKGAARDPELHGADELRRRLSTKYDSIPAQVHAGTTGIPPGEVDHDDPTPASDALQWVRGE